MTEEKCPICLGSGKLQDPVYTYIIIKCSACDGTGIEKDWHKRIRLSASLPITNQKETGP